MDVNQGYNGSTKEATKDRLPVSKFTYRHRPLLLTVVTVKTCVLLLFSELPS